MPSALTSSTARLGEVRNLLFDLDGCIWFGDSLAPAADRVVAEVRARGYGVFFLTNSSGADSEALAAKLTRLGVPARPEHVLAPLTVVTRHPSMDGRGPVLVVGKSLIADTLRANGIEVTDEPDEARVVVVGNDSRLTFAGLVPAIRALDRGARLLALNLDRRVPTENGFLPGTGTLVAALSAAAQVEPLLVGKPSRFYFEQALEIFGVSARHSAMVGDSLETDVAGGNAAGLATVLVRPGEPPAPRQRPDLHVPDLSSLLACFSSQAGIGRC